MEIWQIVIILIVVVGIIVAFNNSDNKRNKVKPLTAAELLAVDEYNAVLAQIKVLEDALAASPTEILVKQIRDLKDSIGLE